jgi:phosphohistidine swiveling domain-containing protein
MTTNLSPPETEIRWELADPADRQLTFIYDRLSTPNPTCPLAQSMAPLVEEQVILQSTRELDIPIADYQVRYCNDYRFERIAGLEPASAEDARMLDARTDASMERETARLRHRWDEEHLPRILQLHEDYARIRAIEPDAPMDPAIVDELIAIDREMWLIHYRIGYPLLMSQQLYDEFIADLAGPDADAHALLAGQMLSSTWAGIAISDLAASARELGLSPVINETPDNILRSRLATSAEGQVLLAQIDAYLTEFGLCQELLELHMPTWQEDPAPLYAAIRSYLVTGADNLRRHQERVCQAERAINEFREQIAFYPQPVLDRFESLLQIGRDASFLHEEHNFYIDQRAGAALRLAWIAIAGQLVRAGKLADARDIVFLYVDEIRELLGGSEHDMGPIIAARRALFAAAPELEPPPFVGPPPDGLPGNTLLDRAFARFFGADPPPTGDPLRIPGAAASRGVVTAPAFVARSLADVGALPAGHVLVTVTTAPSWTPYFGIATAVVTETGGPLSHCAIVAREYGIPAVVGAPGATDRIVTGQLIRVDGTAGEVTLLS